MNETNPELAGLDAPIEPSETTEPTVPLAAAGLGFGVCLAAGAVAAATGYGSAGVWTYLGAFLVATLAAAGLAMRGAAYNRERA